MITTQLVIAALQEAVTTAPDVVQPSFSILWMGKSLFTISFCALVVLALSARAAWRASRGDRVHDGGVRSALDAVLFWGAFTFVLGVFHTAMGLITTSFSVAHSAPIAPEMHELIAMGAALAVASTAYGSVVFLLSALVWFGFRHWLRKRAPLAT